MMIRPAMNYAGATWTLCKILSEKIDRFERKVFRHIAEPVRERTNSYDDLWVCHFMWTQRFKWLGNIMRMDDLRPRGRLKGRWKDLVAEDLRLVRESRRLVTDNWEKALERAKGSFSRLLSRSINNYKIKLCIVYKFLKRIKINLHFWEITAKGYIGLQQVVIAEMVEPLCGNKTNSCSRNFFSIFEFLKINN